MGGEQEGGGVVVGLHGNGTRTGGGGVLFDSMGREQEQGWGGGGCCSTQWGEQEQGGRGCSFMNKGGLNNNRGGRGVLFSKSENNNPPDPSIERVCNDVGMSIP